MRSQLHSATKELAEGRKEIELVRAQIQELERRKQRVAQLETAFVEEERVDWTGRLEPTGQPSQEPAFLFSDTSCLTQPNAPPDGLDPLAEPPLPSTQAQSANEALAQSRQMVQWYRRAMFLLKARLSKPKGPATELERRYQRIVSLCCGVPQDQVDLMLPQLLVALESDGAQIVSFLI